MKMIWPISVASMFIAFMVGLQIPIEIFLNNADEFTISLMALTSTWCIVFVIIFLGYLAPIVIPSINFRERYFAFLGTWALLIWFNAYFLFNYDGAFDGGSLLIDPFAARAIFEAIFWLLVLVFAIIFYKKINKYLFQACAGLLVMGVIVTCYQIIHYAMFSDKKFNAEYVSKEYMPEAFLTFSTQKNIIHIVLDEQPSIITQSMIEMDVKMRQNLNGFIFFPNTAANYPGTLLAIPAMLTGKTYRNKGDMQAFIKQTLEDNAFINALENTNYTTHIYSLPLYCNRFNIENCIPQPELSNNAILLLEYSLFRAAPDLLKPIIYRHQQWGALNNRVKNAAYEYSQVGLNYLAFKYFNENMIIKDVAPTYKLYHSWITHGPRILDKDCSLKKKPDSPNDFIARVDQATCAFSQVFTFIDSLKQAGIYDNTMIIISSDHGSGPTLDQKNNLMHSNIAPVEYSKALATLLIKPFGSNESLQISEVPAALNDMPNTILALLDLPLLPDTGENIMELSSKEKRVREYIYYQHAVSMEKGSKLPPISIYHIDGDVRDIHHWQLKCSDLRDVPC